MILYVIEAKGKEMVKIGITNDLGKRLSGLNTSSPFPLIVKYSFELNDAEAEKQEKNLHHEFRDTRLNGEWFKKTVFMEEMLSSLFVKEGTLRTTIDTLDRAFGIEAWQKIGEPYHQFQEAARYFIEKGDFFMVRYIISELKELIEDIRKGDL